MRVGQRIEVRPKRGLSREEGNQTLIGTIVIVERRYVVVQFKNYRRSFLKSDVQHNIGRIYQLIKEDGSNG